MPVADFAGEPVAKQADVAKRAAEQQTETFLRLILGHIEAEQLVVAEQVAGERERQFRFADTGRAEKQEAAARAAERCVGRVRRGEDGDDARDDVILSANLLRADALPVGGDVRDESAEVEMYSSAELCQRVRREVAPCAGAAWSLRER